VGENGTAAGFIFPTYHSRIIKTYLITRVFVHAVYRTRRKIEKFLAFQICFALDNFFAGRAFVRGMGGRNGFDRRVGTNRISPILACPPKKFCSTENICGTCVIFRIFIKTRWNFIGACAIVPPIQTAVAVEPNGTIT
jgi:hypothetical protein